MLEAWRGILESYRDIDKQTDGFQALGCFSMRAVFAARLGGKRVAGRFFRFHAGGFHLAASR